MLRAGGKIHTRYSLCAESAELSERPSFQIQYVQAGSMYEKE